MPTRLSQAQRIGQVAETASGCLIIFAGLPDNFCRVVAAFTKIPEYLTWLKQYLQSVYSMA